MKHNSLKLQGILINFINYDIYLVVTRQKVLWWRLQRGAEPMIGVTRFFSGLGLRTDRSVTGELAIALKLARYRFDLGYRFSQITIQDIKAAICPLRRRLSCRRWRVTCPINSLLWFVSELTSTSYYHWIQRLTSTSKFPSRTHGCSLMQIDCNRIALITIM